MSEPPNGQPHLEVGRERIKPAYLAGFSFFGLGLSLPDSCLGFGGVLRARFSASSRRFSISSSVACMAKIYDPVGCCIYCGVTSDLTDEHIIPLGLAGEHVLPRASCKPCARVTAKFEGVVLRTIFGDVRMRNKLPTRRKKQRPGHRLINTQAGTKLVPTTEYPAPYVVYQFGKCGLLLDAPSNLVLPHHNVSIIPDRDHDEFQSAHQWDGLVSFKFQPDQFRQMILKIGYGYAIANLGHASFRRIALPYFMQEKQNVSYLVGQNETKEPKDPEHLHKTRISLVYRPQTQQWLVIAEIRLFAGASTPTYHAVVGDFERASDVGHILEKLGNTGSVEVSIMAL